MKLQDNQVVYLEYDDSEMPDYVAASQCIFPPPGMVVVAMLPAKQKTSGGVELLQSTLETYWDEDGNPVGGIEPSVGMVIAIGCEANGYRNDCDLMFGDLVICRDGDGTLIENFQAGNFLGWKSVYIIGRTVPPGFGPGYIEHLPIEETIFAKFNEGIIKPTGTNLLIRKDAFQKLSAIIATPDHLQERNGFATIEAVGEGCDICVHDPETLEPRPLMVGDRVLYQQNAQWSIMDSPHKGMAFIRQMAVLAVVPK